MPAKPAQPRAIGVVRVSQPKGREGEKFASPKDQRAKIEKFAADHEWAVQFYEPELKVSGDALLENRPALSRAVLAVQAGSADVIVAADTSRLWWNHETAALVKRLVQDAGGEVWTVDAGRLSDESPTDELNGTMHTAVDRFSRRQNAEKSEAAVARAIARGVPPWPNVTPGYDRGDDGRFVPNAQAGIVREAFELRAAGATIADVRAFLAEHGVTLSYHGAAALLGSRVVLGELNFGHYLPNPAAHPPIVPSNLWQRVQRTSTPRGRKAKSDRLLARLGVLRCGSCGSRMVVGTQKKGERTYKYYICGSRPADCPRRMSISGPLVERIVEDAVRAAIADEQGRASAESNALEAEHALERAQADLDGTLRAFSGLLEEPAAVERLAELRQVRDSARARLEQLAGATAAITVTAADWPRLTLAERRALIRATVEKVTVAPGRGAERVTVTLH